MSGPDLAPEFLLAAACCRWPPSAERRGAIAAAAARVADWNGFLAVVRRQRIAGLAHAALSEAGIAPPAEIARQLAARAQAIAQRNRALAAETARLQGLFDAARIPALFVKGAALAQLAYGTLALKHARDIDLLVLPEQAAAAMRLLERDDYALRLPAAQMSEAQRRLYVQYGHDVELVSRERNASIELHWRLAYNMTLLRGIDARAPTQAVALLGGAVRTLADDALFAYLCVHGALHGWARLKWLADLNAWLSGRGELERRYREADAVGAGLCAGLALLLCRRLFDLELPAGLQRALEQDKRLARLTRLSIAQMTRADDGEGVTSGTRILLMQWLLRRDWHYWAAQGRYWAVGLPDVVMLPLPRALHFLYPIVRLPLWLWRRAKTLGGTRVPPMQLR